MPDSVMIRQLTICRIFCEKNVYLFLDYFAKIWYYKEDICVISLIIRKLQIFRTEV